MSTNVVIFLSAYYVVNCSETIHCSNNIRAQKIRLTCSSALCKYHFFPFKCIVFYADMTQGNNSWLCYVHSTVIFQKNYA